MKDQSARRIKSKPPKTARKPLKRLPLSAVFYALSDPARLEVILSLLQTDEVSCGQCKSDLSKSTMSHHFKVLREAGLIQKREDGKMHYISLCAVDIEARLPGFLKTLSKIKPPY